MQALLRKFVCVTALVHSSLAFKQAQESELLDHSANPQQLSLINEIGTAPCVFKVNSHFYDFTPIKIAMPSPVVPFYDGSTQGALVMNATYQFAFGWCQQLNNIESQSLCQKDVFAGRMGADPAPTPDSDCMAYSGGDPLDDIETKEIKGIPNTVQRLQSMNTTELKGVALIYKNGEACNSTSNDKATFQINMYCDPDVEDDLYYEFSPGVLGNLCQPYVDTVSKAACSKLSVSQLWEYLAKYSDFFGVFLLIAGLLLTFLGRKLLRPAVCCAGFLTTIFISCLIFYAVYVDDTGDIDDFWYFLGGGAFAGIFVGLLMCWAVKIGAAVLAGWGGFTGGLILYESVLFRAEAQWLFWVTIVVCTAAAAVLAFFFVDHIIIVASSLVGSYFLIRGVSCYAGHYYNEFTMAKMAAEGLLDEIDPWFWAYVGAFFIFLALGLLLQCRSFKAEERARKAKKNHPYMQLRK